MTTIDIREKAHTVDTVTFANKTNGLGKAYKIEKFVPVQFNICSVGGGEVHVKHADIDNLILALKYAKEHWGE